MKPTVLLNTKENLAILKTLLPANLADACELRVNREGSSQVSVARNLILRHHMPLVLIYDTDTLNPAMIAETSEATRYLLYMVATGTPFDVLPCIPQLEAIFFEDVIDFRRIFPRFETAFLLRFAKTQPREQLQVLFEQGGGPGNMGDFLKQLTPDEQKKLQSKYPMAQLVDFIASHREAVVQSR